MGVNVQGEALMSSSIAVDAKCRANFGQALNRLDKTGGQGDRHVVNTLTVRWIYSMFASVSPCKHCFAKACPLT